MTDFSTELTPTLFGQLLLAGIGVSSLNAAQAATFAAGQPYVVVLGYSTPGDGGGAVYVPAPAGAGPGKFQSVDGAWWKIASGPYNIKQFGAAVDGVTNDTTAVANAIAYVASLGGGELFFPHGKCVAQITMGTSNGVMLVGEGKAYVAGYLGSNATKRSTLVAPAGISGWHVDFQTTYYGGMFGIDMLGPGAGVNLGGIHTGNGALAGIGYNAFRDMNIYGYANQGVQDTGTANIWSDIRVVSCVQNTTRAAYIGAFETTSTCTDARVTNVEAGCGQSTLASTNLYTCGIYINGTGGLWEKCEGENSDCGIYVLGRFNTLTSCGGGGNWGPGIMIGGTAELVNCLAVDNSRNADATYSGFVVGTPGQVGINSAARLVNCFAQSDSGLSYAHLYGFDLTQYGNGGASARVVCIGCSSSGHKTATVNNLSFLPHVFSVPDVVVRLTGDNLNLDGTKLINMNNGGAQNVTGVSNVVIGNIYTFYAFNGNTTLKNNSAGVGYVPFLTNTGADVVMASSKVYQFLAIGNSGSTAIELIELAGL